MANETAIDGGQQARARGCLLGQLTGDALGSMVEFKGAAEILRLYPEGLHTIGPSPVWGTLAGQPTDDSELALGLARVIVQAGGFEEEAAAGAYADWLASHPFDVGGTIRTATTAMLEARAGGQSLVRAAQVAASRTSEANGALMRQSPLAIWGQVLHGDALDRVVRVDTALTHPHSVCLDASAAFIVALAATIREGLDGAAAYAVACAWDAGRGSSPSVSAALAAAQHAPPDYEHNQGHVLIALQNAFYQALHASSFEEGVVTTVMGGGDTDTNGAIAGALLGALHGAEAVPVQWREAVLSCRAEAGRAAVRQPRPPIYWPVDALALADALLRAGRGTDRESLGSHAAEPGHDIVGGARAMDVRQGSHGGDETRGAMTEAVGSRVEGDGPVSLDRSRFRAALLGGAIGDALGRPMEGSRHGTFEHERRVTEYKRWRGYSSGPIGTITDDTQLTMCVAQCLVSNGWLNPEDLARRFVAWLPEGRGKGKATVAAVERLAAGKPWYLAGEDSAGNGAAMRSAPIGLLRRNDPELLRSEAVLSALPTHRHASGVAGAVAMAAATAWLVNSTAESIAADAFISAVQASIAGMEEPVELRDHRGIRTTLHERIGELPALLGKPHAEVFAHLYNGAFAIESVPAALYCFLCSPNDVEEMLLLGANAGFDADTVAAMAGTLGGALGGEAALPSRLLAELEYRDELTSLADGLYDMATANEQ